MAVLEGDYANLCGLGLPPSLSLQLQSLKLRLSGALWTAKASASGFSISLYWPTTGTAPEKGEEKKTRRKRRKRNHKVISNNSETATPKLAKPAESANEPNVPINEHSSPEIVSNQEPPVDLAICSEIHYEVKEGVHGVAYSLDDESGWTPVVGKKKRRHVPDRIKRRFPPDHPIHTTNSGNDSTSEEDLDAVIPTGANVDVQFKVVDNTPGLTVRTRNTRTWTPIATRTRARLKK